MVQTLGGTARRALPASGALVAAAALGVLAGVLAKVADESPIPWAGDLGSYPAAWVLVVALLGWSAPTWLTAVLRAAVFFAAMTVAYYAWAAEVLDFGWNVRLLATWLVLSGTAVPATAVAVWWASRRAGVLPGALLALAAGMDLAGGVLQRQYWIWTGAQPNLVAQPVQAVVDVGVALVLVLVLPRNRRTRLWALALLVPMTWLAFRLFAVLQPYTV
jgi:hypothetical protein